MRTRRRSKSTNVLLGSGNEPLIRSANAHRLNILQRSLAYTFSTSLRLLSVSWRVHASGLEVLDDLVAAHERHILAFWHRHYITLFRLYRDRPVTVVTNRSDRGSIIADICSRNGIRTLQISDSSGKETLTAFEAASSNGYGLGITVDGPLGPADEVKRVVPHLASKLQCPVVPVSVAAKPKYVIARRWDHLEIPLLFSSIAFVVGQPITFPSKRSRLRSAAEVKQAIDAGEQSARAMLIKRS